MKERGYYSKFTVIHPRRGEVQRAFVLVPDRDPAAVAALKAYAEATPNAALAADLLGWVREFEEAPPPDTAERSRFVLGRWVDLLAREVESGSMSLRTALERIAGHAYVFGQEEP